MNRQLVAASPAEDGLFVESVPWPNLSRMVGQGIMALMAGVIGLTAEELNRDDIPLRSVMGASGLVIHVASIDRDAMQMSHRFPSWTAFLPAVSNPSYLMAPLVTLLTIQR